MKKQKIDFNYYKKKLSLHIEKSDFFAIDN